MRGLKDCFLAEDLLPAQQKEFECASIFSDRHWPQ
jgi:hypothetical protein